MSGLLAQFQVAMLSIFLSGLARLPLWFWHGVGWLLGWVAYAGSASYARKMREHVRQSGLATTSSDYSRLLRASIVEHGKGMAELVLAWGRRPEQVAALVREVHGWELVQAAQASGHGLLLVTPHLGAFDVGGRYFSVHMPVMAMYRPPRQAWLEPIMQLGRVRGQGLTAPANRQGVRQMLQHLRQGHAVVVLPDQVPAQGDGVWADFWGRPAYTMTLVPRLASHAGATVLYFVTERLPWGRGYRLHVQAPAEVWSEDKASAAAQLNRQIENLIRLCPAQYLWSYNRYKGPKAGTGASS